MRIPWGPRQHAQCVALLRRYELGTVDLIIGKRDVGTLCAEGIDFLVQGFSRGEIPDDQMFALLMAIVLRGMNH
jgi:thymidine phosphorylase